MRVSHTTALAPNLSCSPPFVPAFRVPSPKRKNLDLHLLPPSLSRFVPGSATEGISYLVAEEKDEPLFELLQVWNNIEVLDKRLAALELESFAEMMASPDTLFSDPERPQFTNDPGAWMVNNWAGSGRYRNDPQNPHRIF